MYGTKHMRQSRGKRKETKQRGKSSIDDLGHFLFGPIHTRQFLFELLDAGIGLRSQILAAMDLDFNHH